MTWCRYCAMDCETGRDYETGSICCTVCGKLISQDVFVDEPAFVKGPGGESRLAGTYVRSCLGDDSESHRRTLEKGYTVINELIDTFGITEVLHATSYYKIAVERSFTKGRRTAQVAAACLYIACREKEKSFMLIDFSSHLCISVYELGAVYLQLCRLLSLEEHSFIQKPTDPSLFMHRFTSALIKGDNKKVVQVLHTALRLVAAMKRDWMQTGRKPSGICAAALFVSALTHGLSFSKSDIVKVVHICEATLTQRLIEFENTKSGSLTIEEFNQQSEEFEKEIESCKQSGVNSVESGKIEVVCEHKGKGAQSGFGLCKACYLEFVGGLEDGADPPAFQHADMERLSNASAEKVIESNSALEPHHGKSSSTNEDQLVAEGDRNVSQNEKVRLAESIHASAVSGNPDTIDEDVVGCSKDMPNIEDETDTLSDIDDVEVVGYLNNEEESRFKKIIWEAMNKEYLQEQAAKEAAAAAARKMYSEASDDVRSAQELAAAAAAAVEKSKEKRRQKRAEEAKKAGPARTAAEATKQMLTKKRLSSKINFDAVDELFDESPAPTTKKNREDNLDKSNATGEQLGKKDDVDSGNFDEEDGEDEDTETNTEYGVRNPWLGGNEQEMYDYDYNEQDEYDEY